MSSLHERREGEDIDDGILTAAAILGRRFRLSDVAQLLGRPAGLAARTLSLCQQGVFADAPDGELMFVHERRHLAVLQDVPRAIRSEFHRLAADVILQRNGPTLEIAKHLRRSGSPDSDAARFLSDAAGSGGTLTWRIELLLTAVTLAVNDEPLRRKLVFELAGAYLSAGSASSALAILDELLGECIEGQQAEAVLTRYLATAYLLVDHPRRSLEVLKGGEPELSDELNDDVILKAEVSLRKALLGDLEAAEIEATDLLRRGIEPDAGAVARSALAHIHYYWGRLSESLNEIEKSVKAARISGSADSLRRARYDQGWFLMHAGREAEAEQLFTAELGTADKIGADGFSRMYALGLGVTQFYRGNWSSALANLRPPRRQGEPGETLWDGAVGLACSIVILVERGEFDKARRMLRDYDRRVMSRGFEYTSNDAVHWARALLLMEMGDFDAAHVAISSAYEKIISAGTLVRLSWLTPVIVEIEQRLNREELSRASVTQLRELANVSEVAWIRAASLRASAVFHREQKYAADAVVAARESGRVWEIARSAEAAAILHADQPGSARNYVSIAHESYAHLGAERGHARLAKAMSVLAIDTSHLPLQADSGWSSLTPAEMSVFQLLAEGHSNQEIGSALVLSVRTVETHVSRIMRKLDVSSRTRAVIKGINLL